MTAILPPALDSLLAAERRILARCFAPPPRLTVSEWADRYRKLPPEAAALGGQWRSFPPQREIMDVLGDPRYRRVVSMLPSQTMGKTEIFINLILRHVHLDPCPILLVTFTLDMAKRLSKKRIATAFRDMDCLTGKLKESGARRDSDDTLLYKQGEGWSLGLVGANSPGGLAMDPVRVLGLDEVDRYPDSAGDEGDVIALAEKRTTSYPNRIVYVSSTPTLAGTSRIEQEFNRSDRRRWLVPCPHCEYRQSLEWGGVAERFGLKWEKGSDGEIIADSVRYLCAGCGALIEERYKHAMNEAGRWVPERPGRDIAGFQCTALVSPILRWVELVKEWDESTGNPEQQKAFINTRLARVYEPPGESLDDVALAGRRAQYPVDAEGYPVVPAWAGLLTAAVDVQGDRLEVAVVAWGAGEESVTLGNWRLAGDPNQKPVWQALEALRTRRWAHAGGVALLIRGMAVDTGFATAAACSYVRPLELSGVFATKGSSDLKAQPITRPSKRSDRYKVRVWLVGTVAVKDVLFARIRRIRTPGPGYVHLTQQVDDEFCTQLGAERAVVKGDSRSYERIGDRPNEAIDLLAGNLVALYALGDPVRRALATTVAHVQAQGEKARAKVEAAPEPPVTDQPPEPPKPTGYVPPKRGNWRQRW